MITYAHDSAIILASIVVSLVAAFSGLALTNKIGSLPVAKRKALIVMSAFVLGGGIWSMHFVAMLAHRFEVPIHYDLLQTLSSALVAILVVGLALLILHFAQRTSQILTLAGLLLATGIVSMHFIGMQGMRGVIPIFSGWSIVAAAVVAAVMGVMAIRVSYGTRTNRSIVLGGLLFGFSVVLVHFTAMAGTSFRLDDAYKPVSMVLDPGSLAIVVTVAAFVICGTFLLAASTFLTDHSASSPRHIGQPEALGGSSSHEAPNGTQVMPPEGLVQSDEAGKTHESIKPGAGECPEPPVRSQADVPVAAPDEKLPPVTHGIRAVAARHIPASTHHPVGIEMTGTANGISAVSGNADETVNDMSAVNGDADRAANAISAASDEGNGAASGIRANSDKGNKAANGIGTVNELDSSETGPATGEDSVTPPHSRGIPGQIRIPFERNKRIEFVLSSQVAAVRADGRYTHLYTQEGVRFCPWSIAEAEKRLQGDLFYRSHRSYLINLQVVAVFEKNRDAGLCRFDGYPQLASVPVSRARVSALLGHLGL